MGELAIEARGLRKSFDEKQAVAGIDIEITAGSLTGLVGPNGAGKTTTLSMMTGLLRPDAGRIVINGHDVWADPVAAKAVIGVVTAEARLFDRLNGEKSWKMPAASAACRLPRRGRGRHSCLMCSTWPLTRGGWSRTIPPGCARRPRSAAP